MPRGQPGQSPADDVTAAVERARQAQPAWRHTPLGQRVAIVERFRSLLFEPRHDVARVIARENGKRAAEAMMTEVATTLDMARFYARLAPSALAPQRVRSGTLALWRKRITIAREPYGTIAVIAPWNYPFMLPAGTVLPALVAGIAEVPHGGVKASGYGRSHGALGLEECVRTRTVVDDHFTAWRQGWWFGYGPDAEARADAYTRLTHGSTLLQRLGGLPGTLRLLLRPERPI